VRWLAPLLARFVVRSGALCIAVGLAIGVAAPVSAQPASAQPTTAQPASPGQYKTPEILTQKPSGFWTPNRPAEGGAYRWRLLGIGFVILVITGYGMLRLVRRASRDRASRGASGPA
jgi:hypothetical protein